MPIRTRKSVSRSDSQQSLAAVLEAMPDGFIIVGPSGKIALSNRRALEIFGYSAEELVGRDIEVLVPASSREFHISLRNHFLGEPHLRQMGGASQLYGLRKNGDQFPIDVSLSPLDIPAVSIAAIVRDVTLERDMEAALRKSRDEAEEANAAKDQFLSRMSHELRTPLNAVLGFAQVLEIDTLSGSQRECVNHILRGGEHLLSLINDVLDLTRVSTGSMSVSIEPVEVAPVVDEVVHLMSPVANKNEVSLLYDPGSDLGRFVLADRQRLVQVLLNLVSNGVKYNRPGGSVTVKVDWGSTDVEICAADTGNGIDVALRSRLFSPFDRLGRESSGIEGTGLGLVLSRTLVEAMGGSLDVNFDRPEGTEFRIRLARAKNPADVTLERSVAPDRAVVDIETTHKILYIEDNLANLQLMKQIFSSRDGVRIIPAMQGGIGLELAREHLPDLILLDLNLPDMTGLDVIQALQSDPQLAIIPVVVISADATSKSIQQAKKTGIVDYLTKPLNLSRLLNLVGAILEPKVVG